MSPAQKQAELVTRWSVIEDVQERLAALVAFGRKAPALMPAEQTENRRVTGCVSRIWLACDLRESRCHFRLAADSALVLGLAACLAAVYEGTAPAEAGAFSATILEELRLSERLSPTRQEGLHNVLQTLRTLAAEAIPKIP